MAETLLTVRFEATFGMRYELVPRRVDIIKAKNGKYYSRYTRRNESNEREVTKKGISAKEVEQIIADLSKIHIPAFPDHRMGCDGGYTELEVGGYSGKSHFRWWSVPQEGWEELDAIAQKVIECSGIEDDASFPCFLGK